MSRDIGREISRGRRMGREIKRRRER